MKLDRVAHRGVRIEMIPLIDTFFLLLAFFISSMLSMSVLRGLAVELPAASGARLEPEDLLVVTVALDGQVELGGEPVTLAALSARLTQDPRKEALRVAIRADRSVSAGRLLEVLGTVREAGIRRVGILTQPEPPEAQR